MNYKLKTFCLALLSFVLIGCASSNQIVKVVTDDNAYQFKVEIVTTEEERIQGLMGRESLAEDRGMLFVYEKASRRSFWMKNMLIPLDILFIGSDLKINHIAENVPPCKTSDGDCINYSSPNPAQYVLELSAGVAEELNIDVGDTIQFP